MSDSTDKRIPSFIQFTETNLNKRATKRRSARLEKVTQGRNKKRKRTFRSSSPSRRNPIQLDEINSNVPSDHRQTAPINNNSNSDNEITVPMEKVCDVLGKPVPISNDTNAVIKENDDDMLSHHLQILPISASNNTNVVMEMTSDDLLSRQQPISPINDQDNTEAVTEEIVNSHHHHHHHHHRYWTSPKHTSDSEPLHGCTLSTEASQVKLRKSAPSTTMHSQDLTFKTITLSPDHGHQNIIPPSLLTMATLNVPQKSTAGMAQQLLPPSNRTTLKTEEALPKPTTIRDIKTPSPLSSPITTQKQLLSPSLWPSMHPSNSPILERLDQMSSPEPSEFYSPNLVLDNDNDDDDDDLQQANRRNTISRIITSPTSDDAPFLSADDMNDDDSHRLDLDKDQNGTSGWAVTLGFQGFFDRIKTVFG